jgi:hypothetical protein
MKIGKGVFKTKSGQKAVVLHKLRGEDLKPWLGYVVESNEHVVTTWSSSGQVFVPKPRSDFDLVSRIN